MEPEGNRPFYPNVNPGDFMAGMRPPPSMNVNFPPPMNFNPPQSFPENNFMGFAAPDSLLKVQELLNKQGICHLCKRKKVAYGCFQNFAPTACKAVFCAGCLTEVFHEDIIDVVTKSASWTCPVKRKICPCKQCTGGGGDKASYIDPRIYDTAGMGGVKYQQTLNKQMTQNKLKNLLEFNAQLMTKFQKNYNTLNDDEVKFYLSIIYDNLEKLSSVADVVVENDLAVKNP